MLQCKHLKCDKCGNLRYMFCCIANGAIPGIYILRTEPQKFINTHHGSKFKRLLHVNCRRPMSLQHSPKITAQNTTYNDVRLYLCLFTCGGVQHMLCCVFVFFVLFSKLPVSLDCSFLIAPSIFSNVYL